jgi:hypothetical protein
MDSESEVEQYMRNNHKTCVCRQEIKHFIHVCPNSHEAIEIFGCPNCDDKCEFCTENKED